MTHFESVITLLLWVAVVEYFGKELRPTVRIVITFAQLVAIVAAFICIFLWS